MNKFMCFIQFLIFIFKINECRSQELDEFKKEIKNLLDSKFKGIFKITFYLNEKIDFFFFIFNNVLIYSQLNLIRNMVFF